MAEGTGRARSRETAGIAADWAGGAGRQDGGRAASCQELLAGKTETRECAGQQAGRPAKRWSPLCVCLRQSRALSSDLCERPPLARRVSIWAQSFPVPAGLSSATDRAFSSPPLSSQVHTPAQPQLSKSQRSDPRMDNPR
ncbi:transmembrane protein 80 isoform X3 [Prionailurus viverrinus]|uniref:transmembrane protein 80 isoform X3 n=1 Tax=Prionailurus viverrinus TaxID=61388 RepID=UPI001FF27CD0|nr:transmembrane protein 80 isoform X3 [Prionailurus viverrinus]